MAGGGKGCVGGCVGSGVGGTGGCARDGAASGTVAVAFASA